MMRERSVDDYFNVSCTVKEYNVRATEQQSKTIVDRVTIIGNALEQNLYTITLNKILQNHFFKCPVDTQIVRILFSPTVHA